MLNDCPISVGMSASDMMDRTLPDNAPPSIIPILILNREANWLLPIQREPKRFLTRPLKT